MHIQIIGVNKQYNIQYIYVISACLWIVSSFSVSVTYSLNLFIFISNDRSITRYFIILQANEKKKHKNHIKVESRYYNEYLYLRITTWISILDSNKMLDLFTKNYERFYIFNGKNSICIARCFSWFILRDCMNNVNELLFIKYTYSCMLANIS